MSGSIFRVKTTNKNLAAHMRHLAGGDGNDGFEYDLLVQGADRIEELEAQVNDMERMDYPCQKCEELEECLELAMEWMDNWGVEWADDPEWVMDSLPRIKAAIKGDKS